MKKTVLTFGLISGVVSATMMLGTLLSLDRIGFDKGVIVGYTGIVLSFMLVFFGIRSYRENVGGGTITFGRAVAVGLLITLISCAFYVIFWEVTYYNFMPDFGDKYAAYAIEKAKVAGANAQKIEEIRQQVKDMKAMLDNPLTNAALTFTEPFPIGLIITLISAAVLRKKRPDSVRTNEPVAAAGT